MLSGQIQAFKITHINHTWKLSGQSNADLKVLFLEPNLGTCMVIKSKCESFAFGVQSIACCILRFRSEKHPFSSWVIKFWSLKHCFSSTLLLYRLHTLRWSSFYPVWYHFYLTFGAKSDKFYLHRKSFWLFETIEKAVILLELAICSSGFFFILLTLFWGCSMFL